MVTSNPAYPFAAQAQAEQAAAKASGLGDIGKEAVNDAMLRAGNETVTLEGVFERNKEAGTSPQTIHVHPESRGNATMVKLPGTGLDNAIGSTLVIGRTSLSEIDTERIFKVSRSGLGTMSWNQSQTLRVDGLSLTIPIQAGVSTYLKAEGWIECAGQSTTTGLEFVIVIGEDNQQQGEESDRLADSCAISTSVDVGNTTQWHTPTLQHGRMIVGTDADQTVGVPVFIRVRSYTGGSGSTPPKTPAKFVIGNTYRFNASGVNVRSAPNTGASINAVASIGTTGTIVGGPSSGSGLKWWQISNPAGWVAEAYITNTTAAPPPEVTTNRIRSAWLRVSRIPK